jgi:hypothetical protein
MVAAWGLMLLCLRCGVSESGMFHSVKQRDVSRGNFLRLFSDGGMLMKYLHCIFIGLPIWCVVAIFISLSPEMARRWAWRLTPTPGGA